MRLFPLCNRLPSLSTRCLLLASARSPWGCQQAGLQAFVAHHRYAEGIWCLLCCPVRGWRTPQGSTKMPLVHHLGAPAAQGRVTQPGAARGQCPCTATRAGGSGLGDVPVSPRSRGGSTCPSHLHTSTPQRMLRAPQDPRQDHAVDREMCSLAPEHVWLTPKGVCTFLQSQAFRVPLSLQELDTCVFFVCFVLFS